MAKKTQQNNGKKILKKQEKNVQYSYGTIFSSSFFFTINIFIEIFTFVSGKT